MTNLNPKRYRKTSRNIERAERAESAVNAYKDGEGLSPEECMTDLFTDLRHWARQNRLDFDKAVDRSISHYEVEASDQTGDK